MAVTADRRIAGAAAAFAALAVVASARDGGWLADADRALFEGVRAHRGRAGTVVARIISAFGEPAVVYPALLAGAGAARQAGWQRACVPCLVVAGGAAARRRLSQVIAWPRPPAEAWLTVPEGYSLPPKHTTLAALAADACVCWACAVRPRGPRRCWRRPASAPAASTWACTGQPMWSRAGCSPRGGCAWSPPEGRTCLEFDGSWPVTGLIPIAT